MKVVGGLSFEQPLGTSGFIGRASVKMTVEFGSRMDMVSLYTGLVISQDRTPVSPLVST